MFTDLHVWYDVQVYVCLSSSVVHQHRPLAELFNKSQAAGKPSQCRAVRFRSSERNAEAQATTGPHLYSQAPLGNLDFHTAAASTFFRRVGLASRAAPCIQHGSRPTAGGCGTKGL